MGRSVLAVIAGALVMVAGVVAMGFVLVRLVPGVDGTVTERRPIAALALLLSANLVVAALGGYVTALVAPRDPVRHALALGVVQWILYLISALSERSAVPLWWHLGMIVFLIPLVWLGGQVRAWQTAPRLSQPV
jgi:hypothetical protein